MWLRRVTRPANLDTSPTAVLPGVTGTSSPDPSPTARPSAGLGGSPASPQPQEFRFTVRSQERPDSRRSRPKRPGDPLRSNENPRGTVTSRDGFENGGSSVGEAIPAAPQPTGSSLCLCAGRCAHNDRVGAYLLRRGRPWWSMACEASHRGRRCSARLVVDDQDGGPSTPRPAPFGCAPDDPGRRFTHGGPGDPRAPLGGLRPLR